MIIVDTSVWIDHLRKGDPELGDLLQEGLVYCHPFIRGELACGNLKNRDEILTLLGDLPASTVASHDEVMQLVGDQKLQGKGLGWIDAHLLASALLSNCPLWTRDKALSAVVKKLGVTHDAS